MSLNQAQDVFKRESKQSHKIQSLNKKQIYSNPTLHVEITHANQRVIQPRMEVIKKWFWDLDTTERSFQKTKRKAANKILLFVTENPRVIFVLNAL